MIYLVAGHKGPKTGAVGHIDEGAEAICLRNAIAERIVEAYHQECTTDHDDATLLEVIRTINSRPKELNDLVIDLHFNAVSRPEVRGTEAYVSKRCKVATTMLAQTLCREVANALETHNRGVHHADMSQYSRLAILEDTRCPAILLEVCFVTNQDDCTAYIQNFERVVHTIAALVHSWSGI